MHYLPFVPWIKFTSLQWRHNGCDSISNHQPHHCFINGLFRRRSKKTSSSASLAFVRGIHQRPVNSPHKWPVTRKMFPFDDVIMQKWIYGKGCHVFLYFFSKSNSIVWILPTSLNTTQNHSSLLCTLCWAVPFCCCRSVFHEDVIKWKHFRVTGPLCRDFSVTVEFPSHRPVARFLWSVPEWTGEYCETGDLRRIVANMTSL